MKYYIIEYKYKLKYAPTTGTTLARVEAKDVEEAILYFIKNPKVEIVLAAWICGEQLWPLNK